MTTARMSVAGGSIYPSRFVKPDTTQGFAVLQGTANAAVSGISQKFTKAAPIPSASTYAATSGDSIQVHQDGEECLLELAGTVDEGDFLKSDGDGKGVVIATSGTTRQNVGARALEAGVSGDLILVKVMIQERSYAS